MERLGELLALASVHLLPQRADAADLVLPSKLANMLASGRPVVAGVHPGRGLAREVEGAGLICAPEDAAAMAAALERLLDDPSLYESSATEAVRRAHADWSRPTIIGRFAEELQRFAAASRSDVAHNGTDGTDTARPITVDRRP
jgi:colanic acid biosynthesis glycosyl transferase WcaI